MYSDYVRLGYLTVVHIEAFTKFNQRCHILRKMLSGLYGVGISYRRITWKLMDKCKINTVWVFEDDNDMTKDKSICQHCLQLFYYKSSKGLASHLQSVGPVAGEMVWLKYTQQPLSKAA